MPAPSRCRATGNQLRGLSGARGPSRICPIYTNIKYPFPATLGACRGDPTGCFTPACSPLLRTGWPRATRIIFDGWTARFTSSATAAGSATPQDSRLPAEFDRPLPSGRGQPPRRTGCCAGLTAPIWKIRTCGA